MNPSLQSYNFQYRGSSNEGCKKRDHSVGPVSPLPEGMNENLTPFTSQQASGDQMMMMMRDDTIKPSNQLPIAKRTRLDESNDQPVVQLHVREASNSTHAQDCGPAEVDQPMLSAIPAVRKNKNRGLSISIPPVGPTFQHQGLAPSPGGTSTEDPVTPLYQIVHTPTIAPGAPGPGNIDEIRRLERSWATNMREDDQISPDFPNFQLGQDGMNQSHDLLQANRRDPNDGTSAALREMFELTASAKTPTFTPESFSLMFKKDEDHHGSNGSQPSTSSQ
ncbi:uncharacterized protein MELLADRAFT_95264 [Melampsora larici-populina 98AG31]|uniref:Uncharacterized protein n=1 Tax=Melampsora larici-populina (strain 98AG31 / pathotype 3-4-7) TaxID=747676 RepID=F4RCT9_MELLP|nr:uncharacterized protein MELLADRAFT_95264 [Melampsora larici-populina 98AG31]EGG09928.1 hypothetical protein MELLADRAFT_95264 [Melampsora larici-populina 98AG31]